MRLSFISAVLASSSAAAPALAGPVNLESRQTTAAHHFTPLTLEEARHKKLVDPTPVSWLNETESPFSIKAACSNPRIRKEWDNLNDNERQNFVNAIKCLDGLPKRYDATVGRTRYDDLIRLHQKFKDNIHQNAKFLIWHRQYLRLFEDLLREECGYNAGVPWFDETRYAGRFSQSSIFSAKWFGSIAINGCVTNGQFANRQLTLGPSNVNTPHCMDRKGDASLTANTNQAIVDACNARSGYANMAACAEGGAHAYGHNGIGGVMSQVHGSPGDPVFFLHHAFIDRNFAAWQLMDPATRLVSIDGLDVHGQSLTMDTEVSVDGIKPNVRIRDILNTLETGLCYRYDY